MLHSDYKKLCAVKLPYQGRQKYMHTFDLAKPVMAAGFEDYLAPVIALCRAAGAIEGIAHITVDEKIVLAGMSQRRPKPHVDGCFIPALNHWGHDGGDGSGGGGSGGWNHYCNDISAREVGRMPVIVAASVAGCRAWRGVFDGRPAPDGDLTHIAHLLGEGEVLPANTGYWLSPDCVHESMIFSEVIQRTFLRIALPAR
jgi:hypothetical protein